MALITQCRVLFLLPALQALKQLLAGSIQIALVQPFSVPLPQMQGQAGRSWWLLCLGVAGRDDANAVTAVDVLDEVVLRRL